MHLAVIVKRIDISDNSPTNKLMDIGDKTAIEFAVNVRDKNEKANSKVSAICIAPSESSEVIRECFSSGADHGYLLDDKTFESVNLDGLITLLNKTVTHLENCDVVLMSSPSSDNVTVSLGKKLADALNFKHIPYVESIERLSHSKLLVRTKKGTEVVEIPVLINLACDLEQHIPNASRIMKIYKKEVTILNAKDLDFDLQKANSGGPVQLSISDAIEASKKKAIR